MKKIYKKVKWSKLDENDHTYSHRDRNLLKQGQSFWQFYDHLRTSIALDSYKNDLSNGIEIEIKYHEIK